MRLLQAVITAIILFTGVAYAQEANMDNAKLEKATFAGGCFWCMQPFLEHLKGVKSVTVGYTGGHTKNPTYEEVCTGQTGHAESVLVAFDPARVTYEELLRIFFEAHDPTQGMRQGGDIGSQYRSAIFVHNLAQRETASAVLSSYDTALRAEGCLLYTS